MRRHRTPHRDDRGVVAIEFVFILPFLLMLVVGIVALGNVLSLKAQANELARAGARAAALGQPLPEPDLTSISEGECAAPVGPNDSIEVEATLDVSLRSIPLIGVDVLPSTITESVTMRCGG
jgi:Flp pilus assembly protein TadG